MVTQTPPATVTARRHASAWSDGCARFGEKAGIRSYRIVANVAENVAFIVTTAIAIRLTSNSPEAASATLFCCEASHPMKDCKMSAPSGMPVASTAIVPNMHVMSHSSALAPAYIPSTPANASGIWPPSVGSAAILSQFVVSTIG